MERLTHKARYEAGYKLNSDVKEWQAADRLAAYENTGFTPEEIMDGKMLTGWIPVSERLPKNEGNYVIAFCKSGEICVAWYEEAEETWETDACYLDNVLAWMPLPEPYKAE